eukprot:6176296-Pleurochrysis_carterae.AAC.1
MVVALARGDINEARAFEEIVQGCRAADAAILQARNSSITVLKFRQGRVRRVASRTEARRVERSEARLARAVAPARAQTQAHA